MPVRELHPKPHLLIVHLFSGHRRANDIHCVLQSWAHTHSFVLTVLSSDTATSVHYGNLSLEHTTWAKLTELYEGGHIAATISGSPCETFSAARAQDPPADLVAAGIKWPRPLRSFARLYGLDRPTCRELRQLRAGTAFFLQTTIALSYQLVYGGYALSEHPWVPIDPTLPSTWTSAILRLLQKHPMVKLHRVEQWKWGASVTKPTGLLAIRLPNFVASMHQRELAGAQKPQAVAIGVDEHGVFRTAAHKAYPPQFSAAMAGCICDQILADHMRKRCREAPLRCTLSSWVEEAAAATSVIRADAGPLPDYQERI